MSKGTAIRGVPTELGRGRQTYRAPELLLDPNLSFNKKVDIWSLGCILHELCVGRKAFESDGATLQFYLEKKDKNVVIPSVDGTKYDGLQQLICETIRPDAHRRPSATSLRSELDKVLSSLSVYAQHSDETSPSSPGGHFVIGIDFGTTYSGVAYARCTSLRGTYLVNLVNTWPHRTGMFTEKTPTVLAYNTTPPLWGGQVQERNEPQINYFKLGLQENFLDKYSSTLSIGLAQSTQEGFLTNHKYRHPALPDKGAVDFAADYLTGLLKWVLDQQLPRQYGEQFVRDQQFSFVITVPTIWSDTAKHLTRQAAEMAGIPKKGLTLITEPEAAALYCSNLCNEINLNTGDSFLMCDAGGGTVVLHTFLPRLTP